MARGGARPGSGRSSDPRAAVRAAALEIRGLSATLFDRAEAPELIDADALAELGRRILRDARAVQYRLDRLAQTLRGNRS